MKIDNQNQSALVSLHELEPGDTFMYCDDLWIKCVPRGPSKTDRMCRLRDGEIENRGAGVDAMVHEIEMVAVREEDTKAVSAHYKTLRKFTREIERLKTRVKDLENP